ncbi:Murein DD-endopeptidase MepM and murein hydrolase activator NlpD, contain LysM domain [Belliella buryatensis]|uniref:Murein DD-endopeptidase MepM and murein hydrolase activator NlpD, contain LysM domain n=1 Tax=Belliella buryatensis TaxID=1500549 RepID=A0A239D4N4_9BACT|nr:M23 family metallopeptidase [Belliella buryatensis]SNS27189.1 Murein DD-endopeptidase MepM and murein hydrolase activator NlpD, contain LysM domain [Belliella buryatensis]
MSRIKYYYDPKTCKYERYQRSKWDITLNTLGFLSSALILAVGILIVFNYYFDSPKELILKKENKELKYYYQLMESEVNQMSQMLVDLQQRDDNLYRVIFETEPIPSDIRRAGVGGTDRYKEIKEKGLNPEKLIIDLRSKVDDLKRQLYVQNISYDEVSEMALNKDEYWASIPAIQPIINEELTRLASGFGNRLHPILKVRKLHTGVDFSAPKGTPIYATGDGVVIDVKTVFGGYGKYIEIDHGFGFVTRYAHMNEFTVRKGQKVKRGDQIGTVGNTGSSTAPHVHYEILKDGRYVNPVHYFFKDLEPSEYEKILELASKENQSLS